MSRVVDTGTDQLLCAVADHVATVSFCPEKRNALGDIVAPALREILLVLEADPDVRVIVLTGVGKAFWAGGEVKGMGGGGADDRSIDGSAPSSTQQTLSLRLHELPKPDIAALPGAAAGASMSIALACDIRIGAKSAFYATGFAAIGLSGRLRRLLATHADRRPRQGKGDLIHRAPCPRRGGAGAGFA